jgi:hypothetical protein
MKVVGLAVFAVATTVLGFALLTSACAIDAPNDADLREPSVNETAIYVNGNANLDPADG